EAYKAWYVPIPLNQEDCQGILAKFKPFFADESIRKIGQNLKYDLLLLSRYGVEVRGELFDTMLAHYLLDPDTRHGMDVLAENYLGYSPISITELIGPRGAKQGNMKDVTLDKVSEYAAEDADVTLQLSQVFQPMLVQA